MSNKQQPPVSITFTGSASPYCKGDVAGFTAEEAQAYIDAGVAELTPKPRGRRAAAETGQAADADQAEQPAGGGDADSGAGESPDSADAAAGE